MDGSSSASWWQQLLPFSTAFNVDSLFWLVQMIFTMFSRSMIRHHSSSWRYSVPFHLPFVTPLKGWTFLRTPEWNSMTVSIRLKFGWSIIWDVDRDFSQIIAIRYRASVEQNPRLHPPPKLATSASDILGNFLRFHLAIVPTYQPPTLSLSSSSSPLPAVDRLKLLHWVHSCCQFQIVDETKLLWDT